MKDVFSKILSYLALVLLLPIIVVFCICYLLYLPADVIIYYRSLYYRDTKEKYRLYGANSDWFRLYNLIKKENIPISYVRNKCETVNAFGYFYTGRTLIVTGYVPEYDESTSTWYMAIADDDGHDSIVSIGETLQTDIDEFNSFMEQEVCNRAVLLVNEDEIPYADELKGSFCDYILLYTKKDLVHILRSICATE